MSTQGDGQRAMAGTNEKLTAAVEDYLDDLRKIRSSGGATGERSYYPPLTNLLNAIGSTLKPKVFCVSELAQQGAGHPDLGLYAAKQMQRGRQRDGQLPRRRRGRGQTRRRRRLADRGWRPGEPLLGPLPAGTGLQYPRLRAAGRGRAGPPR